MYDYLVEYSEKYEVPLQIALGIAKAETGYEGPFHWDYNPVRVSSAGACGAMQILPSTATYIYGERVTKDQLLNDLELNVEISMKYMAYLYKMFKRWDIALGYYNTGTPVVNNYAMRIMKNT
jgi:soluble lytic murein transglycosylase-like protein